MAYDIWLSLITRDFLSNLKQDDPETYHKIRGLLHDLSLQREDFQTGAPERIEVFIVNHLKVYYRIIHRLKSIDVKYLGKIIYT
ncbi:MAG: hypothetical protein EWV83_20935 [Microcystis sp. M_OC_Ca_00000000_S217Cul]|uniref:hypothetical protein n=1 Tax=unclassified Microcystis TaxID=2643300 RepID=UPI00118FC0F4|nr:MULTISPECIES: hypothetical protein [unclassified Microcystis]TRT71748.1 MAG: hypothetical protein EWV83_20935 [Microcystis sp. M_OC_Ca_00000000_S217Cul]TRT90999.1 MAG: hypothetical protein EWV66_07175 [Microcystis sp. M_OC_Ca_00000000_C217Col]